MTQEFVPYEQALKLKQLGFDESCFAYWGLDSDSNVVLETRSVSQNGDLAKKECSAPTFSQAFRWFRDTYGWQHSIQPTADQHSNILGYNYWIWNYRTGEEHHTEPKNRPVGDWEYETYEEAELACLNKLIEIVESDNK